MWGDVMKVGYLGLLFALSATSAMAQNTDIGAWNVSDKVSALDGSRDFEANIKADGPVANIIGNNERPSLGISCNHQGLFIVLSWPDFIDKDFDDHSIDLMWKIDDGPVERTRWDAVDQALLKVGNDGLTWAKKWSAGKSLVVRVPDKHGGQEATFQLAGLDQVVEQVSRMKCG
jgi:hypothetical protein